MKKIALLLVTIISLGLSPQLFANVDSHHPVKKYRYDNTKVFTFVEEGITFSIFKNGEFDFYINPRRGMHVGVDLDEVSISYNSGYNYDPYVQYDDYGAIIQIENTPIYYDSYGRIIRAGDVKIRYRSNRVNRIGSLNIYYNNYGHYSYHRGYVNIYNRHHVFHPYHNFFVLPIFNRCIVSYRPYRNRYRPTRYNYYYGKTYHKRNNRRSYNSKRGYKKIDKRVRTRSSVARSNKGVSRRSTSANNTRRKTIQRNTSARNNRNSTRTKRVVGKTPKRTVQRRTVSTDSRIKQPRKVVKRRTVKSPSNKVIKTRTRSTVQNRVDRKPVQRTVRTQTRKTPQRSVSKRTVSTRNRSSVQRTERKPVQRTVRTQTRKAPKRSVSNRSSSVRSRSTVQRSSRNNSVKRTPSKRRAQ